MPEQAVAVRGLDDAREVGQRLPEEPEEHTDAAARTYEAQGVSSHTSPFRFELQHTAYPAPMVVQTRRMKVHWCAPGMAAAKAGPPSIQTAWSTSFITLS